MGYLYYIGQKYEGATQCVLYRTNGTISGIEELTKTPKVYPIINTGFYGSYPKMMPQASGYWFFYAKDANDNINLYSTNRTAAGTYKVLPNVYHYEELKGQFIEAGGELYAVVYNQVAQQYYLISSDGTPAGTAILHTFAETGSLDVNLCKFNGNLPFRNA